MNKFSVWRLTQYSQVALIATDSVFAVDTQNPGTIFTECKAHLCAVRDGVSRFMKTGVLVVMPSTQRLDHIMETLYSEPHHFAMTHESFLTIYAEDLANKMVLQFVDKKWNSCLDEGLRFNTGWESTGYNVLHYCSW